MPWSGADRRACSVPLACDPRPCHERGVMDAAALIFDCDGTLADSMPAHYRAWCKTLDRYGIGFPHERFTALAGVPTRRIVEILGDEQGVDVDAARVARERDEAFYALAHQVRPIEPVLDVVRAHRGRLPMAVATGGVRRQALTVLRALDVLDWFDIIVSAEDVAHPKPAPDTFLRAAERLDVPPTRCVAYEDGEVGLTAARAAGMTVVDVRLLQGSMPLCRPSRAEPS